ncbi:MAG: hypothetical protein KDK70_41325, partial [Myxococcales bacterium]|nr:hypothetical protein [Myxococcales bacterium]
GPSHARTDERSRVEHAATVARTLLTELAPPPAPRAPAEALPDDQPIHPPTDAAEFERLQQAIRTAPLDELDGPARRLAAAEPDVWPQIREGLRAELRSPKGDYRSLLAVIGGDVPNRYGHFALSWKKAHGHSVKLSQDWMSDLLSLPPGRVSAGLLAVYRDCVLRTALLRAAAHVGAQDPARTGEVVATLLDVAYLHQGILRDEVGRALVAVGDEAIPHLLVESMTPPGPRKKDERDDVPLLRAQYAQLQLDKMDRLHPLRATAAVRDQPRLLARVLSAYATARPGEAAAVLLDFSDAPDATVRSAARSAFTAYVEGPPPPTKGRTIRLLGGGTGLALAHLSYRQRAGLAVRERMAAEVPDRLEPECEVEREDGSIDGACEGQPQRLTEAYFAWLDERRTSADAQAIDDALADPDVERRVARLDRLLVGNPALARADRLVPVYREAAEAAQARGDAARAGQLLRKAARLTEREQPHAGQELRVQALLAEASVPRLTPDGRRMLLSSAERLAPEDPRV